MTQSRYSIYYQANKAKCLAASRAWRLAHPEEVKEIKRKYRDRRAERDGRTIQTRRHIRHRRDRLTVDKMPGLTGEARELIGTQAPIFFREGFNVGEDPGATKIFDKDGVQIRYEGDEDLELEKEAIGGGRRGLKAQAASDNRNYYQRHKAEEIERSKLYNRAHPEVQRKYSQNSIARLKYNIGTRRRKTRERRNTALTHYGNGKIACVICGEVRAMCLTVDYINIGQDRATRYNGEELYRRLIADGFPEGYHTICFVCQLTIRREDQNKMRSEKLKVIDEK